MKINVMKVFIVDNGKAILLSGLVVFAPVKEIIIVATLAIVVDLITGIIAARKRGEEIKSSKMATTVSKFLIVQTAILMCFLVQNFMLNNSFPLVNWVAAIVGSQQIYSIMENLNSISGGQLFSDILTKLQSINAKPKEEPKKDEEKK